MGHGIALGNDRDQIDLVVHSLHELDIQGLERVTRGGNEVQAGIDTRVGDLAAIDTVLLLQVGIEAALDCSQDGLPAIEVGGKEPVGVCLMSDRSSEQG